LSRNGRPLFHALNSERTYAFSCARKLLHACVTLREFVTQLSPTFSGTKFHTSKRGGRKKLRGNRSMFPHISRMSAMEVIDFKSSSKSDTEIRSTMCMYKQIEQPKKREVGRRPKQNEGHFWGFQIPICFTLGLSGHDTCCGALRRIRNECSALMAGRTSETSGASPQEASLQPAFPQRRRRSPSHLHRDLSARQDTRTMGVHMDICIAIYITCICLI
jgi:hypothetical protein